MSFRIAICDDEEEAINHLKAAVDAWSLAFQKRCEIYTFSSAEAFLFSYAQDSAYDILLLDVEMKSMSGIALAKRLRNEQCGAEIIFITSHFEFIGEGYEVDALHYLVKPVAADKLAEVLTKAALRLAVKPPSVTISCEGETIKLYESDILYVEAFLHYLSIHTAKREYRIKESLSAFADRLSDDFFRVHRSYLVSLKHVTQISRTAVRVENERELPLARGKYDAANRAFIARN